MRAGLVTLALLFASCGEKPVAPAKAHWDVIHTFGYDVKAARASPRTPPDATNEELLKQAVEVIARRLHVKDRADIGVWVSGPDTFQVGTRGLGPVELGGLPKLVVRRGTVEFLIEVRPDERYREFRSQGREPARSHVWPGTAAAFDAYKKAELDRWRRSRDAGKAYQPGNPRFALVPVKEDPGDSPDDFRVVELPASADETFDDRVLRHPVVARSRRDRPVVVYEIAKEKEADFGTFTEGNIGLPLAILVDGVVRSAPIIQDRLTRNVQVALEEGTRAEMQRRAEQLVTDLRVGGLPVAPVLRQVEMP